MPMIIYEKPSFVVKVVDVGPSQFVRLMVERDVENFSYFYTNICIKLASLDR